MLPYSMTIDIQEYLESNGKSPFSVWFKDLDAIAAAKVGAAIFRLEQGNFSRVEGVGSGVFEYKIDFGPGYRVYFGKDGEKIIILLCGGTKRRQNTDIALALARWQDYKQRKKERGA